MRRLTRCGRLDCRNFRDFVLLEMDGQRHAPETVGLPHLGTVKKPEGSAAPSQRYARRARCEFSRPMRSRRGLNCEKVWSAPGIISKRMRPRFSARRAVRGAPAITMSR